MGTMLQRYNFSEEDFRGERFKDFPFAKRKQRFIITNTTHVIASHAAYFEAGADIVQYVLRNHYRYG
jgi:5-methyltetrahydrofolate--homocysteine methyltransferase